MVRLFMSRPLTLMWSLVLLAFGTALNANAYQGHSWFVYPAVDRFEVHHSGRPNWAVDARNLSFTSSTLGGEDSINFWCYKDEKTAKVEYFMDFVEYRARESNYGDIEARGLQRMLRVEGWPANILTYFVKAPRIRSGTNPDMSEFSYPLPHDLMPELVYVAETFKEWKALREQDSTFNPLPDNANFPESLSIRVGREGKAPWIYFPLTDESSFGFVERGREFVDKCNCLPNDVCPDD